MSYFENLSLYFALLFGIIIVPGMDMLFVLANALTGGRRAGLAATAGIMLGGAIHTAFGALSVAFLLGFAPSLLKGMMLAGAAYMAWIGFSLLRSSITVSRVEGADRPALARAFRQGAITCLINPKAYLFTLSVFPQFIKPQFGPIWSQALAMGVLCVLTQLGIYGSLAVTAGKSRDFLLSNPAITMWIGRIAGMVFILVALMTFWQGVAG